MSRLGKQPVAILDKVEVEVRDGLVRVKGPKGVLEQRFSPSIKVEVDRDHKLVRLEALDGERETKARHGLYRALVQNMVLGVAQGYRMDLMLEGVGYRVTQQGQKLDLNVGFCHTIEYILPPSVKATMDGNTKFALESHDKRLLGQIAAEIRSIRPPEPYKLKGIRFTDEVVRKKVGKAVTK